MPPETIESLAEQEPAYIQLAEKLTEEQIEDSRKKAEAYPYEKGAHSTGKSLEDLILIVKDAVYQKRFESIETQVGHAVANIRGFTAELLSKSLSLTDCETVYGKDGFFPNCEIVDPYDHFINMGGFRKDVILINDFFETRATSLIPKEGEKGYITDTELDTLKKDTVTALFNFDKIEKKIGKRNISRHELIKWYVENEGHQLSDDRLETQNKLIGEALAITDRHYTIAIKSLIETGDEPVYFATTIPDEFLIDREGRVVGVIEVKAYTPSEVKSWIRALNKSYHLEYDTFQRPQEEIDARAADAALYDRKGTQVNILDREMKPVGLRLGANVEGLRYFVNIVNKKPEHTNLKVTVDLVNDETAEVTQQEVDFDYPVILRLPKDIPSEDIIVLGALMAKLGIRNVAIQKLPFTYQEINEKGFELYRSFSGSKDRGHVKRNIDPDVTAALNLKTTWVELPES